MSGCGEVPELPEWYTLDVSNIFGLSSGGVRFGAGWYSSVNLLWVEILYSMASGVWAMVEGGWYGVGGCCGLPDAEVAVGSHGLHGLHVGDGVAAWMEKKERQLLVPALCVFSSVIALVCDTAEVLHTEEKWSFLLRLLHVFPFTLAAKF